MLADRLGVRRVSIGDLYRRMAAEHGMTALQFNLHSELDDKVDHYIDQLQHDIAASGERLVVDSRLAWHFFTDALKVHLIADPAVAARRVLARPGDAVENYASVEEAGRQLAGRSESERQRFLARYGVDKNDLRNYDLVCDTTRANPEQVVARIVDMLETPASALPTPACHLDPNRVRPAAVTDDDGEIVVHHQAPHFFAIRGQRRLSAAVRAGETMTAMVLTSGTAAAAAGPPVR
ncbi:putative cytidylate kinase [Actinoplanes campanulatus]|uniref:Putative cytidylate kinase n=2 Tax=Actinoplanes campanulatus TaxID=113559 RepID=A0A7W5AGX1_9ACTN|nr:putative cytidylate kinase [Actinoplanes campanulatus]